MQDITVCSADTLSGAAWARLAPLSWISSSYHASLYKAQLQDAIALILGKCERSEQGAGRGESTITVVPRNRFHSVCYSEPPIPLSSQLSYVA